MEDISPNTQTLSQDWVLKHPDQVITSEEKPTSGRNHLALNLNEFTIVSQIFFYWKSQPDFDQSTNGTFPTFEETRNTYIKWTYNYLKQFYPKVEYQILQYKKEFELEFTTVTKMKEIPDFMYDTVAFKFAPGRPEVYLLISEHPIVMDERRFEAYEGEGKFVRPNWSI